MQNQGGNFVVCSQTKTQFFENLVQSLERCEKEKDFETSRPTSKAMLIPV